MKRKTLLVENVLLSPLPLIILIHLTLYHYYPPTNDTVQATVSLSISLPTNDNTTEHSTTRATIPPQRLALGTCPWASPEVKHF